MTLECSEDRFPHVLEWLDHTQQHFYNDPLCQIYIPAKLLLNHVLEKGESNANSTYPGNMEVDADIQRLIDQSLDMRYEQHLRNVMEAADLTNHEHSLLLGAAGLRSRSKAALPLSASNFLPELLL
jgi:hypothetical protein